MAKATDYLVEGLYICPYCGKESTKNGICSHVWRHEKGKDFVPITGHTAWNRGLTKETNEIIAKNVEDFKKKYASGEIILGGYCSKEYLGSNEHRESSAKGGRNSDSGGGRSKRSWVNDSFGNEVCLQSTYELKCSEVLNTMGIKWTRPSYLEYCLDGKKKRYFPDFLLTDHNIYLDPKNNYLAQLDKRKINQVIEDNDVVVYILTLDQINESFIETLLC